MNETLEKDAEYWKARYDSMYGSRRYYAECLAEAEATIERQRELLRECHNSITALRKACPEADVVGLVTLDQKLQEYWGMTQDE